MFATVRVLLPTGRQQGRCSLMIPFLAPSASVRLKGLVDEQLPNFPLAFFFGLSSYQAAALPGALRVDSQLDPKWPRGN